MQILSLEIVKMFWSGNRVCLVDPAEDELRSENDNVRWWDNFFFPALPSEHGQCQVVGQDEEFGTPANV